MTKIDTNESSARPYDEEYGTMMDVAEDPTGAKMAIHALAAERDQLRREVVEARNAALDEALAVIVSEIDMARTLGAMYHIPILADVKKSVRALKTTPAPRRHPDSDAVDRFAAPSESDFDFVNLGQKGAEDVAEALLMSSASRSTHEINGVSVVATLDTKEPTDD